MCKIKDETIKKEDIIINNLKNNNINSFEKLNILKENGYTSFKDSRIKTGIYIN